MIFHEVDDEEKDGLMSMLGFEEMKIVDLVEVMEKCQPPLKKKIFKAIKEQEQSNENITKGLLDANAELQEQNETSLVCNPTIRAAASRQASKVSL